MSSVKLENISSIAPDGSGRIDVPSDLNLTGSAPPVYRINGTPLSLGQNQTPWLSNIDGAGFNLNNAGAIGIGTNNPVFRLVVVGDAQVTANTWTNTVRVSGSVRLDDGVNRMAFWPHGLLWYRGWDEPRWGWEATGTDRNQLALRRYDDAGVWIDNPLWVSRSTGVVTITEISTGSIGSDQSLTIHPATDFFIQTAGTERVRITPVGNVGIGTTTPTATLQIAAPGYTDASVAYGAFSAFSVRQSGAELAVGTYTTSPWPVIIQARHSSNASHPLILNPVGGNVGIGTSAPQSQMHVHSTAGGYILRVSTDTGNTDAILTSSNQSTSLHMVSDFRHYVITTQGSGMGIMAGIFAIQDLSVGANRIAITANGDFGIGNTATVLPFVDPAFGSSLLHAILGKTDGSAFGSLTLCSNTPLSFQTVGSVVFANYFLNTTEKRIADIRCNTSNSVDSGILVFNTANAGDLETRIIIAPGGIGIGTLAPEFAVDVVDRSTVGAFAMRLSGNRPGTNNVQLRFAGSSGGTDLWAIGTDISSDNGARDFEIYVPNNNESRFRLMYDPNGALVQPCPSGGWADPLLTGLNMCYMFVNEGANEIRIRVRRANGALSDAVIPFI